MHLTNQRWKGAERRVATELQIAAGVVRDKVFRNLVTTTGRVGHLTELGFDILVGNPEDGIALVGEVKRRQLPKWLTGALVQIVQKGVEYDRTPVFAFTLADDVPVYVDTKDGKKRIPRDWVAFPLADACRLIAAQREQTALRNSVEEK